MMQHRVQQFVVQYLPSGLLNMNTPSGPPSAAHGHHHHQHHHHQHHHHGHHHHHHQAGGLSPPTKGLGFFAPPTSAPFSGPLLEPGYPINSAPSFAPPSATTVFSAPSPKAASWHPRRAGIFNSYGPAPSPHLSARSDDTNVVATPWWLVVVIGGLFVVFIAVIVWICIRKRRGRQALDPCSELKSIRIDPRGGDEGFVFYNVTVNKVFNLQDEQQQQAAVESVKDQVHAHGVDNGLEFENVPLGKVIDLIGDETEQQQQELAAVDSVEGLVFYNVPLSKFINLEDDTEQQQQEHDGEDEARQQRLHQAAVKFLKESAESLAEAERQKRQEREQMFCAQVERILRDGDEHAAYVAWIEQQVHAEVRLRNCDNEQLRLIEDEQREQLICLIHADCINRCSCNKKQVLHDDNDQCRVWEQQQSTHGFLKKFEDEEGKKSRPDSNQQNWQQQERGQEEEQSRSEDRRIRKQLNANELRDEEDKKTELFGDDRDQQQQQKIRAQAWQIAAIIHNHKQQQLQRIREHTAKQKERVEATADEHKQRQPWQELEKLTEDEEAKLFDDDERDQQQQQQSRAKDKQKEQNQRAEDKQMERVDEHKHRQLWQELETERAEEELARLKQREERMTKTKEERQLAVFHGFLARRAEMEKREQRQQQGSFVDKDGRVLDLPLPPCRSNPLFVLDPGEEMLRELRAARLARFERDVQRILDMDR